jgi:class 3 adenylate cyclase
MTPEEEQLEAAVAALEAQRAVLGDAVVASALGPMRARLAALRADGAPVAAAQALKQVSIVFMDIVGSTRMTQRLDPEDTSALMDGTLARAAALVRKHRGKVLQYAGDSLLAAFGADRAAEDDAERAVRCSLALCQLGRTIGAELQEGGNAFSVRVGVHTGEVLLGGGVSETGPIRGINVNIAARLEQTAPAGAARISHDTHLLVRGVFEVEAQPPLQVKGVDAPLRSWIVRGERPSLARGPSRGIEGVATRMIGRDDELEVLQGAYRELSSSEAALAAISVIGDAGIGKSRLVDEFVRWAEAQRDPAVVLRGRTTPQTVDRSFGLLADFVTRHLRIADDDTMAAACAKVERGIAPLFDADNDPAAGDAHAHLLGHLLGIEWPASSHLQGILQDPKQIRNRAFHAAALVVRRTAERANGKLVVLVEDLHWADDESLDFLSYLLDVDRDVPMLVLAAMRPTLLERRPDWLAMGSRQHRRVDLAPLDRRASRELTHALMQKLPDVPPALRDLVTEAAEGNPFYIEELVQMLIDQGVIATGATGWTLQAETLPATRLPATLTGVLQARLDGLPAAERLALQQASVIGPVFWDRALAALDAQAAAALPELVRRELVLARPGSAVDGFAEYAFKHHLLHQVAYGTVLKRARRELHGRLATWLTSEAEHGGVRAGDVLALIAHHFEAAGDDARAAEFHARAAVHAAERFAHAAVLLHADRALALLDGVEARDGTTTPEHAALRWRVLLAREKTNSLQGRRAEQRRDLQALDALAQASADDRRRAEAALRCSLFARVDADWAASEGHATRCAGPAPPATTRIGCRRRYHSRSRCAAAGSSTRRPDSPTPGLWRRANAA